MANSIMGGLGAYNPHVSVIATRADLTTAEEKTIEQVLTTWFNEQPVDGAVHLGSNWVLHPDDARKMFWKALFQDWDTNDEPFVPELKPRTFDETAIVIGNFRTWPPLPPLPKNADPNVPEPKDGEDIYCQPIIDRRLGEVKFHLRTRDSYRVYFENVNLTMGSPKERCVHAAVNHRDECERHRITEYNLEMAVSVCRKRLRASVRFGRLVPENDLAHLQRPNGFVKMDLARVMQRDFMMRQGLRGLANNYELAASLELNNEDDPIVMSGATGH